MRSPMKQAALRASNEGHRTGKKRVGRAVLAERSKRKNDFLLPLLRQREIEKVIKSRCGKFVPETDDADAFIRAAAFAINAHCRAKALDLDEALDGWCRKWAPWVLPKAGTILRPILIDLHKRVYDMKGEDCARLICLTYAERVALGIKTMGACDVSEAERKRLAKDRKREADRLRQAENRKASGGQSRVEWLAQNRVSKLEPWKSIGVSRRGTSVEVARFHRE